MAALSYKQSGVDIEAADRLVSKIAGLTRSTLSKKVKSKIGGYASLYEIHSKLWLAASTDGVGTKLKLAFESGIHHTVGVDLVAMSVNDLICVGAKPLFFLDYFATGKLAPETAASVISGIVEGCKQSQCSLVGGETAEMPSFYSEGEYDLAGFAVGMVEPKAALPTSTVRPGDVLLGVGSSGAHSNGYSLLRKLLPENGDRESRVNDLLVPTRIYVKSLDECIRKKWVKGLAHITGSGFLNIPRISSKVHYEIEMPPLQERAPVFKWIVERSGLPAQELYQTFNMGIGMVIALDPKNVKRVTQHLQKKGEKVWLIGEITRKKSSDSHSLVHVKDSEFRDEALLRY